MKKQIFRIETNGFNGAWYPCKEDTDAGMILMLGDSSEDTMAKAGAKWMNDLGFHVMAMSADKKDYGHHNYPLERFGLAITYMKAHGCEKIGIAGASTTGMMALTAASTRTAKTACGKDPATMNPHVRGRANLCRIFLTPTGIRNTGCRSKDIQKRHPT